MKYSFLIIVMLLGIAPFLDAQATFNMSSGELVIESVDEVTIMGHAGSGIEITTDGNKDSEEDKRAKGLKEINANGLIDNTGIGLATIKNGNTLRVNQVARSSDTRYIFKVPSGVSVSYEHSTHHGETIKVENTKCEIEVSANHNDIEIRQASGPLVISTVHGDIDASFSKVSLANDIKLYSTHGHVDVTVPNAIKADFRLKTSHGKMFTDLNLEVDKNDSSLRPISSSDITGKTNGGGIDFSITSVHSNIYLRKE